nr:protein aig1 [Ipomoea batatas]GMD63043.1 protein aig1 [Ipomoea batatas]
MMCFGPQIMSGSEICEDGKGRNLVLVGRTGNGKSATGNSILGRRAFKSMTHCAGVTSTCEFQRTVLDDGQIINVIDTPGLFDFSGEPELIRKEIAKCINMVKDGIHAVLIVFSVRNRFTREEEAAVQSLCDIFGRKLTDYLIIVFTGGDDLEESEVTLDEHLGHDCPEPLKQVLKMCGNRKVLFDNKTRDASQKAKQLTELLRLVNTVVEQNSGKPYHPRDEDESWEEDLNSVTERALRDAEEAWQLRMQGLRWEKKYLCSLVEVEGLLVWNRVGSLHTFHDIELQHVASKVVLDGMVVLPCRHHA